MQEDYTLKMIIEAQDKFSAELKKMKWQIDDIQTTAKNTSNQANNFISSLKKWIAGLWLWAIVVKTTKSIIDLADNLEKSEIAFTTMLWSVESAQVMLEDLSNFAKKTPFELTGIRQNAQQLIAMWVSANDIIPTLKSLWDVASWLSVPLERLALNYGQVIAQWKLTWRELRDFTMAWVPLLDQLAQQLWKTTTAIQDMISKWQISSNDVVEAFRKMTSEWWKFEDLMWKQATTLTWMRSNLQDELNSLWEQIWKSFLPIVKWYIEQISTRVSENSESIKIIATQLFESISIVASNIVSVLKGVGQVAMELFFGIKQDWSNSSITFWQIFMAVLQKIWQWIEAVSKMVSQLRTLMKTWSWNVKNWLWWIGAWIQSAMKPWVKLQDARWEFARWFWTYKADELVEVKDLVSWITNDWIDFGAKVIEQENQLYTSFAKTESYFSDTNIALKDLNNTASSLNLSDTLDWDTWWSWWKSKVEKMSDEMKELIKDMENYAKESEEMRKATYEWIIDWMEEAVKSAEKLADEIDSLQTKINDLNSSENVDIASAYIEAEQTLKNYKKEYEDIVELAQKYSKSELENQKKDRNVNGFSAEDLLEVKNAYESMQSAFKWLSEEQTKALNDQIESQKAYNELNDIEKIKADYEEKRAVIQAELEEKLQAFEKEANQYQILSTQKEMYEKKRLDYMHYSYKEQQTMATDLINLYTRLANAKAKAWMSWWSVWAKAWWWDVYRWDAYIVWEHWPELFIPSQRWSITPNNQITNNNGIEININGAVVRNDNDIQAIADEITRRIKLEKNFWIA